MKKGFTLIELLGVIIILGIIATLIYPSVLKTINNQRIKLRDDNIQIIEQAAKQYTVLNENEMVGVTSTQISVQQLKNAGLLGKKTFKDPTTNTELNGCVKITTNVHDEYVFKYTDTCE